VGANQLWATCDLKGRWSRYLLTIVTILSLPSVSLCAVDIQYCLGLATDVDIQYCPGLATDVDIQYCPGLSTDEVNVITSWYDHYE